ncbi:MFS-type transporter [Penicillium ucsense]|uniref:MFS-type transporter n=1 Tax=Penicillium ucsense TaxID=2839758 RepID=A0A8J8W0Y7_9EURO|nr:MFS-type transporter [Penicillium ucsense]KAF7734992.1 MFS-type transporter [Penicillium ucsense]
MDLDAVESGSLTTRGPDNEIHTVDESPPNGGYGWVCTFCVFVIIMHTWGVNSAWGVILAHFLSHSTFQSATRIEFAFIGGLSISQALLIGPLVTKMQKALGTRVTLLVGTALVFGALYGAAYATEIWHLSLSQGICFGMGMGFLYIPAMSVLPHWFTTHRSLSMGIAGSGAGIGGITYNLVTGHVIETLGVRTAYKVLAFCTLGANLVSCLLLRTRDEPRQSRQKRAFDLHDFRCPEVLLVVFWGVTTEFGYIALIYSLPNYASSIGLSTKQGSITAATLNLGLTIGRPLVGYVSDKFGRITTPAIMTAFCGMVCLMIWIPAQSYPVLLLFALLSGTVCGTFWGTVTPVLAEVVGLWRMSSSFSLICLTLVAPTTVAEPIALSLVRGSGYLHTQAYVGCMFFLGSFALWILRCWKIFDTESKEINERDGLGINTPPSLVSFLRWVNLQKLFRKGRV